METQSGLFADIPVDQPQRVADWRQRLHHIARISDRVGGLLPVSAVPELLGVSRPRVYQLIDSGALQRVELFGVPFVGGDSIKAWKESEPSKGGRGHKRAGLWKSIKIASQLGDAIGDAIFPE